MSSDRKAPPIRAVVPMKRLDEAKQRLGPAYPPGLRRALVVAMLRDVLAALAGTPGLDGIAVITADPDIARIARDHGASLLADDGSGLNAAVTAAGRRLAAGGDGAMLVVPGDVPAASPGEFGRILAAHRDGHDVVIVPANDRRGTNALLVAPPDGIAFAYGEDSFAAHRDAAQRAGLAPLVLPLPGLGLDCDYPDDVARFARLAADTETRRVLVAHGIAPPP